MLPRRFVALVLALVAIFAPACSPKLEQVDGPLVREQVVATEGASTEVAAGDPVVTEPPTTQPPAPPPTLAPTTSAAPVTTAAPTTTAPRPTTTATTVRAAPVHPAAAAAPSPVRGSIEPYNGLGTWVDVYDWSHYKGHTPTVGPGDVDRMAAEGVQTLYIQTAKHDTPDLIMEPELLLPILERAREVGIRTIAWYLPTLEDTANDLNRLVASANLPVDGLAVDIEARQVQDVNERNRRLIELSAALRDQLPGRAIGGIVLPPVVLEVVNPNYWPNFPYREIAPYYDVWQTMGYWTNRKADSGYRDPYKYTDENIRRLRNNLGQPAAPVHPIGGIGGAAGPDLDAFHKACVDNAVLGGSLYDWRTTDPSAWAQLRRLRS